MATRVLRHQGRRDDGGMFKDDVIAELRRGYNGPGQLTEMALINGLVQGFNDPRFDGSYLMADLIALRAVQGHSGSSLDPKLMDWQEVDPHDAPRLYHGTS